METIFGAVQTPALANAAEDYFKKYRKIAIKIVKSTFFKQFFFLIFHALKFKGLFY